MSCSGFFTYGTIFSIGCRVQPVSPASAREALASCRKLRRETPSGHSEAWRGNSRWSMSSNSGVPASSSRLRQSSGPRFWRSFSRSSSRFRGAPASGRRDASAPHLPFTPWSLSIRFRSLSKLICPRALAHGAPVYGSSTPSPVTGRAARQRLDVVLLDELRLQGLRRRRIGGWLPAEVEDLFPGTDELARIAVTRQAPLHLERRLLVHQRHAVHPPMAGRAADSLRDMDAVVEVDEIGQVVHAGPFDRHVVGVARPHRLEQVRVRPDLLVAVHADLGGRDPREARLLDGRMAVAAVDPEARHVMLMAERHGLLEDHTLPRGVWRPEERRERPSEESQEEDRPEDADLGDRVRAAVEDLHADGPLSLPISDDTGPLRLVQGTL